MDKKVIIIAGLVFSLLFIMMLAVTMGTIMNKGNSANTKLVDTLELTDSSSLGQYTDGGLIKGESVVACIKNIKSIGGDKKLGVLVTTKAGVTTGVHYGYKDGTMQAGYSIQDSSDKEYINPTDDFLCTYVYNTNNVLITLKFDQQ